MALSKLAKVMKYLDIVSELLEIVAKVELLANYAKVGDRIGFSDIKFKFKGKEYEIKGTIERIG